MSEIPKAYEPQAVEEKWYDYWLKENFFTANPQSSKPAYSIVIPPPNVTGMLHMGHVLNNTIQDILARKARMDGKEVLWLPGTEDRKSTRLNSSHDQISYAVFCLKKKKVPQQHALHAVVATAATAATATEA